MERTPKILVFADEPMFIVTMLSELEDRGFAVVPMKPGGRETWPQLQDIDAAVFDLHQPNETAVHLALKLRRSTIPVITLGNGPSVHSARLAGDDLRFSKPVDYDRLADRLYQLASQPLAIALQGNAGAIQRSCTAFAEEH
ncbi:response regulator [Hoeflea sp. YIM 152468]|uniref:response regulator n=1 Tax=Hoeflea sp. YIM 152468 TaxID=3031759 RepID=UPI0023DC347E|nr:response regulator [Hoeflea sp. YIM 152468]MDF1610300.1 response regulator [Hoeflea sp. YIM 152468]